MNVIKYSVALALFATYVSSSEVKLDVVEEPKKDGTGTSDVLVADQSKGTKPDHSRKLCRRNCRVFR